MPITASRSPVWPCREKIRLTSPLSLEGSPKANDATTGQARRLLSMPTEFVVSLVAAAIAAERFCQNREIN